MKAISVRQPWAYCLFHGKPVENRDYASPWSRAVGTRIWVHASAGCTKVEYEDAIDWIRHVIGADFIVPALADLPRGAIIGSAFLEDITTKSDSPWFCGPWGLILTKHTECVPVPAKGMLGLWEYVEGRSGRV